MLINIRGPGHQPGSQGLGCASSLILFFVWLVLIYVFKCSIFFFLMGLEAITLANVVLHFCVKCCFVFSQCMTPAVIAFLLVPS